MALVHNQRIGRSLLLTLSDRVDLPIAEPSTHDHIFLYSTVRRTAAFRSNGIGFPACGRA